jgi:hypothetical protein
MSARSRRSQAIVGLADNWQIPLVAAVALGAFVAFTVSPVMGLASAVAGAAISAVVVCIMVTHPVAVSRHRSEAGVNPWPDDPPIRIQPCPICGGEVEIALASMVKMGNGPETWMETGTCSACRAPLARQLADTDRPVVFMTRLDWYPFS